MDIEQLRKIINESRNYSDVLRRLDLVTTNGNYETLKKVIKEFNIDITHFTRKLKSKSYNGFKKPLEEILKDGVHYDSSKLRKRLLQNSIKKHSCENCHRDKWLDNPIPLQLHHINGKRDDNRIENIQLLCPNCHVLTENYGSKNMSVSKKERKHPLGDVLKRKPYKDKEELLTWFKFSYTYLEVSENHNVPISTLRGWVKKEGLQNEINDLLKKTRLNNNEFELLKQSLLEKKSFYGAGKVLNLSDNGVRKRCKKYNIPTNKKDLLMWLNENTLV